MDQANRITRFYSATSRPEHRLAAAGFLCDNLSRPRPSSSIHDAGQSDGTFYLVSELVEGATLADRIATGRLSFREAAEWRKKLPANTIPPDKPREE